MWSLVCKALSVSSVILLVTNQSGINFNAVRILIGFLLDSYKSLIGFL